MPFGYGGDNQSVAPRNSGWKYSTLTMRRAFSGAPRKTPGRPRLIGVEACSGAHHRACLFQTHVHTVRLMAPKFVTAYRLSGKRGKNDSADAAAICEAVAFGGIIIMREIKVTS